MVEGQRRVKEADRAAGSGSERGGSVAVTVGHTAHTTKVEAPTTPTLHCARCNAKGTTGSSSDARRNENSGLAAMPSEHEHATTTAIDSRQHYTARERTRAQPARKGENREVAEKRSTANCFFALLLCVLVRLQRMNTACVASYDAEMVVTANK